MTHTQTSESRMTQITQIKYLLTMPLLALAIACAEEAPTDRIRVSGHVEATEVRLAADAGGRILTLTAKEGDRITAGQTVLTLDTRDTALAIDRAEAERAAAEAQVKVVQAAARPEDVRQAESQIVTARADQSAAESELAAAAQDLERFESLLKTNSGSQKQRDDAATRRNVARDRVSAAQSRVRTAEETLARVRAGARREDVDAARARVTVVGAQIASLEKTLGDATLVSPVAGIVSEKLVEVGEIIPPRAPALVVVDLDHAWADVFVPEPVVPMLRIGQQATVFTDAGGAGLTGTLTFISPKAEFTPRNVQTAEERSKLVYRIRISVDNKQGVLKQGMPVEAELLLSHK